ncbi:MAG: diguanylate cyclase [Gammaproteobacteria bacterium]|nr:diguanylate cyclase [Gammaproteobacteria bacterium]
MSQKPDNTKIPGQGDQDLRALLDNYPGVAYRCLNDGDWTMMFISAGVHDLTGYRPDQLLAGHIEYNDIIHPDDREYVFLQVQGAIGKKQYYQLEYRVRTADGQEKWVWEQGCGVFNAEGELLMLEGFINDITERKQTEQQLALLVFALNHVHEATYLIDEHARFLYVNDEACRALGYSRGELQQMGIEDIDPGYSMELWEVHWNEIRNKGAISLETSHQRKDGHVFPVEISANYFEYDDREYNLALARDITTRKEQEARIQHLAYHDALTDLPNRNLSLDRLGHAMSYAKRHGQTLAILFLDLDNFKVINDTMGHPVGDELLRQVGGRLSGTLREQDTIGRVGGDEFLIFLPELSSAQDAAHVTEKILAALIAPFEVTGYSLHVTASVGISLYPRDASDVNTLVKYADTALYLAKDQGRNTFKFFSPELDQKIHDRLHMENDLRQAIKNNEFLLHYQPQFNLATGVMTGVEALLRWQHPVRGLIPPGDFIPLAEDIGRPYHSSGRVGVTHCRRPGTCLAGGRYLQHAYLYQYFPAPACTTRLSR